MMLIVIPVLFSAVFVATYLLGLLINLQNKQVEVYSLVGQVMILDKPMEVDYEIVMSGFKLSLRKMW